MDDEAKWMEISRLAQIIREGTNEKAKTAVDELRQHGWLTGGSLFSDDLGGINLRGADLSGADLSNAHLLEANLRNINLSRANMRRITMHRAALGGANLRAADLRLAYMRVNSLSRAILSHANLSGADLNGATIDDADLHEANFSGADLGGASLQNADLSGADLSRTNLNGAKLWQADFTEATLGNTSLGDVDLSSAKGLRTIKHRGPSTIGVDTLYRSRGKIPEEFLRGCGVPDNVFSFLKSLVNAPIDYFSCFISYSHDDKLFAGRLHDMLRGRGIRCWVDIEQTNPGDDIYAEIERGITHWDKVLLCCSKSSLSEKWWVDHEIDKAFQKERDLMKERKEKVLVLIPLDLDGFVFDPAYSSPKAQQIRSRIAAEFKGWEDNNALFEREIERVIKALRTDGGKEDPPESKL